MRCPKCGEELYFSCYPCGEVLASCSKCGYCEPVKIEELDDHALREQVKIWLDEVFMWLERIEEHPENADEYNYYFEWSLEDLKTGVKELLRRLELRFKNV